MYSQSCDLGGGGGESSVAQGGGEGNPRPTLVSSNHTGGLLVPRFSLSVEELYITQHALST